MMFQPEAAPQGDCMRYRLRSLVIAALALGLAPCVSWAKDDPAKTIDTKAGPATFGPTLSSPETGPTLPVTAERLALVRQYMAEINFSAGVQALTELFFPQIQSDLLAKAKNLSEPRKLEVMAAFNEAWKAAYAEHQARYRDEVANYVAARLTDEELKTVVDFYGAGVGYNMIHSPQSLTPEDRQEGGKYILSHPELLKFSNVLLRYTAGALSHPEASRALFNADFKARFCQNLAKAQVKSVTCSEPGLNWTFQ
jgi:hypothetical protein